MRRVVIALLAALTAACGSTSAAPSAGRTPAAPSAGPTVPPVPGIAAEAVRLRTDEVIGSQVQVRLTDTGQEPFTVTSVAIDSPGFTPLPATPVTAHYAPRQVIDLPTPFGAPVCGAEPEPAAARLTVVRPDGRTEHLRVPLAAAALGAVHDHQCAVLAVAAVVAIDVGDLHDEPGGVAGTLRLTRRSGTEPVTAGRLGRSVLIEPTVAHLPLELPGDQPTASAGISFAPAGCDPHVLAETKQPYRFVLGVTVANGDEVPVDLPLDRADEDALAAMVDRVCRRPG